jgi:hypothetical protein
MELHFIAMRLTAKVLLSLWISSTALFAQGGRVAAGAQAETHAPQVTGTLTRHQRFAYDAVRAAVALPQGSQQDRLRVLAAASAVMAPIRPSLAKTYSREGLRLELELIQRGEQPSASMLASGPVDCGAVQALVEGIPAGHVSAAEPTLVAAVGSCPAVRAATRRLVAAAIAEQKLAPRATLALMEHMGVNSAWSGNTFARFFESLPSDPGAMAREAPNIAALYAGAAASVDTAAASRAGVQLLQWLNRLPESGDRVNAVNVSTGAMKQVLGEKAYEELLAADVVARQVAQSAGAEGGITQPKEDQVSVLKAMQGATEDRVQQLQALPAVPRARQAAASGFASGTAGDRQLSSRYFDLAFSALNLAWRDRQDARDPAGLVQEVSEAAAQVDASDALHRAQSLEDSAAQAIAMVAVARVVGGDENLQAQR